MQSLIILRGAPSSGKSTIARGLKSLKNKVAWLKVDSFKPFFAKDVAEENEAIDYVNQAALASLEHLLKQDFSVVMEGIFQNPKYISAAVDVAKQANIQFKVYELECPLEILQTRDRVREGVKEGCRKPLGNKIIAKLNQIIQENPWNGAEKLDTEKLSLDECVDILSKNLKGS